MDLVTVEPRVKRGMLRYMTAGKVKRTMNAISGGAYQRALENAGLGWSIMCRAEKSVAQGASQSYGKRKKT